MKQFILPTLLFAATVSSCSKDDLSDLPMTGSDNPNIISFDMAAATTKGTDLVAETLRSNSNIFLSYIDDDENTGVINYDYIDATTGWAQVGSDNTTTLADEDAVLWSEVSYPIQFYSMNNGGADAAADVAFDSHDATSAIKSGYSVPSSDIKDHVDLLYMSQTVSEMPGAGKVRGVFDHALSKVEFTLTTKDESSDGYNVMLLETILRYTYYIGTGTITASTGAIAWDNYTGMMHNYDYFDVSSDDLDTTSSERTYSGVIAAKIEDSDETDETWNMKLIPQTFLAGYDILDGLDDSSSLYYVEADAWTADLIEDKMEDITFIDVLYRMTHMDGTSVTGYASATDYLNDFIATETITQETIDGWITKYGDTPLYTRVGFAFSSDYTIDPSMYYQFNLDFFSHGGIIIDDHFYDQTGTRTDIPIPDDMQPGEPVIPEASTTQIGLLPTVTAWGDVTSQTVE